MTLMDILGIVILIVILLILGGLLDWLVGKWRFARYLKKIDRKIIEPENLISLGKQFEDQLNANTKREEINNGRKRELARYNAESESRSRAGKPRTEEEIKQYLNQGRDERRSSLQDSNINQTREPEQRDERTASDNEEDWPSFD